MFKNLLLGLILTVTSISALANEPSKTFKQAVQALDQALSFDTTIEHAFLNAGEEYNKRKNALKCGKANGDVVLNYLEQQVLQLGESWLTTPERKKINAWLSEDSEVHLCVDENIDPLSDDFYQAKIIFLINVTTQEGVAFRVDWMDW